MKWILKRERVEDAILCRFKWSLLPFSAMLGGDLPQASHTMHLPNVGQQPKKLLPTSEATTKSASNHQLTSNNLDQKSRLSLARSPFGN